MTTPVPTPSHIQGLPHIPSNPHHTLREIYNGEIQPAKHTRIYRPVVKVYSVQGQLVSDNVQNSLTHFPKYSSVVNPTPSPSNVNLSSLPPIQQGINPDYVFGQRVRVSFGTGYGQVR